MTKDRSICQWRIEHDDSAIILTLIDDTIHVSTVTDAEVDTIILPPGIADRVLKALLDLTLKRSLDARAVGTMATLSARTTGV